jgi:multiple sugar transport system substrate-binding protein
MAAAGVAVGTACRGQAEQAPPSPAGPPVEIQLWGSVGGTTGPGAEAWDTVLKSVTVAYPRITVVKTQVAGVNSAGYNEKLLAAVAAGAPPDAFCHDGSSFSTPISMNAFMQLDKLLARDKVKAADWRSYSWDKVSWAGHVWGLPNQTDDRALFYNRSEFRDAGLDPAKPPVTTTELDAAAPRLTRVRGGQLTQLGFVPWIGNWYLFGWWWAFGAKVYDAKANRILYDAPEAIQALDWVVTYAKRTTKDDVDQFLKASSGVNQAFMDGRLAALITTNSLPVTVRLTAPALDYGIAPVPYAPGAAKATWSGGFVLGVPTGAKYAEEGWLCARTVTSAPQQTIFCEIAGNIPTNLEAGRRLAERQPETKPFVDLLAVSKIEPVIPEWSFAWDEMNRATDDAVALKQVPKDLLQDANRRVQLEIDKRVKSGK